MLGERGHYPTDVTAIIPSHRIEFGMTISLSPEYEKLIQQKIPWVATLKPAICGQSKPAISNNARTQVFTPLLADEASTF